MHKPDKEAKSVDAKAVNGAARSDRKRWKRRRWNAEEKIRITRNRLSAWRSQLRQQGKLVAPSLAKSLPQEAFAAVEERPSPVIKGRGVTVRLEGAIDTAGIASIAVALAGSR